MNKKPGSFPTIHFANIFFEEELKSPQKSLKELLYSHPIYLQLQYLPSLYKKKEDFFLASSPFFGSLPLFSDKPLKGKLESWAPSLALKEYASKKGLSYEIPPWDLVKKVHRKDFRYDYLFEKEFGELFWDFDKLLHWVKKSPFPKVLKKTLSKAGRGHLVLLSLPKKLEEKLKVFCQNDFPILAEPWFKRVLDFSSQWEISPKGEIQLLGTTLLKNNQQGVYLSSQVGEEKKLFGSFLPFVKKHLLFVENVCKDLRKKGFFGNLGIDAFVYEKENQFFLHPLVEINARKTMGYVALQFQQHSFPGKTLRLSYLPSRQKITSKNLLPEKIETTTFPRALHYQIH